MSTDAQAVKTLAHEAGHVLLHTGDKDLDAGPCRGSREVEAESAAYLVTCAHGLDSAAVFEYGSTASDPPGCMAAP